MNDGGSADYYKLPEGVTDLQDLIEYKDMSFSIGNILKSAYRLNNNTHSDRARDLRKIIWFAERELAKEKTGGKTLYINEEEVEFSPEDDEYFRQTRRGDK